MKKSDFKIIIIICLTVIFETTVFFSAKLTPFNKTLLDSNIDRLIPYISQFIFFYILWYIFLFLIPYIFYKKNKNTFYKYLTSFFISIAVCGIIYFFFPTCVERPIITNNNLSSILTNIIYKIDTPVNCLPSGHCLLCFYFIIGLSEIKNIKPIYKILIFTSSVLIILSTVFVKQHVLYDVISALILSIITWFIVNKTKIYEKLKQRFN